MTTSAITKNYGVNANNYISYVGNALNGQKSGTFTVGQSAGSASMVDPAPLCSKLFTASYTCGNDAEPRVVTLDAEAYGKTATFSCTKNAAKCAGFQLTLGDDGNLVMTNGQQERTWQSNTNSIGLNIDKRNAKNSKYGRNYLQPGDTLAVGEFIGSPSGNCYLIMDEDKGTGKVGLQLRFDYPSCDGNTDAQSMKMYSIPKQHISNIGKIGYVSEDGLLHEYPSSMVSPGTGFDLVGKYDTQGNTLSQSTEANVDACKTKCNTTPDCAAFVYGSKTMPMVRYIRMTANDGLGNWNERQCLQIGQIAVYSNGINVALNKTTTSGPQWHEFKDSKMIPVNGKMLTGAQQTTSTTTMYHSSCNQGDFFQIDLGMEYPIERIVYYNRGDSFNWRATFQNIAILNAASKEIKKFPLSGENVQTITLTSDTAGANQCFLKNKDAYPTGNRQPSSDYELYVKNKKLTNNNSCNKAYETTNTQTWEMYPMGEKMSMDTLCSLGAATEQEQKELARKRLELDELAEKIKQKLRQLRGTDSTLVTTLDKNLEQIEKDINAYQKLNHERKTTKEATLNVDGMQEDSSLNLTRHMYQHILYSILAILVVMGGTIAYKKMLAHQ